MTQTLSPIAGWIGAGAIAAAGLLGWALRRLRHGPLAVRMRPHLALGYAAFGAALVHAATAGQAMGEMSGTEIRFATAPWRCLGCKRSSARACRRPDRIASRC